MEFDLEIEEPRIHLVIPILTAEPIATFDRVMHLLNIVAEAVHMIKRGEVAIVVNKKVEEGLSQVQCALLDGARRTINDIYGDDNDEETGERFAVTVQRIDLDVNGKISRLRTDDTFFGKSCATILSMVRCEEETFLEPYDFVMILNPLTYECTAHMRREAMKLPRQMLKRQHQMLGVLYDHTTMQTDPSEVEAYRMEAFASSPVRLYSVQKLLDAETSKGTMVSFPDVHMRSCGKVERTRPIRSDNAPNKHVSYLPRGFLVTFNSRKHQPQHVGGDVDG